MAYQLPALSYAFDALEPHIDAKTMEIHHGKHHQAYIDKANAALAGTQWDNKPVQELIKNLTSLPSDKQTVLRNNAGGHLNHELFWESMNPNGGGEPAGELAADIATKFGSFSDFRAAFKAAGIGRFGSGWAWLVSTGSGIEITSTANQDNPLTDGQIPLLGLDVWEHAYYLNYQNRRPDYIDAWWNVVDWSTVTERFEQAKK